MAVDLFEEFGIDPYEQSRREDLSPRPERGGATSEPVDLFAEAGIDPRAEAQAAYDKATGGYIGSGYVNSLKKAGLTLAEVAVGVGEFLGGGAGGRYGQTPLERDYADQPQTNLEPFYRSVGEYRKTLPTNPAVVRAAYKGNQAAELEKLQPQSSFDSLIQSVSRAAASGLNSVFGSELEGINPKTIDSIIASLGATGGELAESPEPWNVAGEFLTEQAPQFVVTPPMLRGAGAVAEALGVTGKVGRAITGGTAFGASSAATTYPLNVEEGLIDKGMSYPDAQAYAATKSGVQGGVDAFTGALKPFRIGGSEWVNTPAQIALDMTGGASGYAASQAAVGEEIKPGDMALEGLLEGLTAPIDVYQATRGQGAGADVTPPPPPAAGGMVPLPPVQLPGSENTSSVMAPSLDSFNDQGNPPPPPAAPTGARSLNDILAEQGELPPPEPNLAQELNDVLNSDTPVEDIIAKPARALNAQQVEQIYQASLSRKQDLAPESEDALRQVVQAGAVAAESPLNDLPEPTEGQKEAGNYKKGHVQINGLDISIENPRGSVRRGTDPNGQPWEAPLDYDYGYIRRSNGADGEQIDVFIGDNPLSNTVFVIDQNDPDTGKFDEHKSMVGFDSQEEAVAAYQSAFTDGKAAKRLGSITPMTAKDFKGWIKNGDGTKPLGQRTPDITEIQNKVMKMPARQQDRRYNNLVGLGDNANNQEKIERLVLAQEMARRSAPPAQEALPPVPDYVDNAPSSYEDADSVTLADIERVIQEQLNAEEAMQSAKALLVQPRSALPKKPKTIMQFLKERGGVRESAGELANMGITAKTMPGFLNNTRGLELDYAREALEEAGYLPQDSDINDMLELIDQEARGKYGHLPGYEEYTMAQESRAEADRLLSDMGVDVRAAIAEERARVARENLEKARQAPRKEKQTEIAGAEAIGDGALAQRRTNAGLAPKVAQRAAGEDGGLFDTGARQQQDLTDLLNSPKSAISQEEEQPYGNAEPLRANDTDAPGSVQPGPEEGAAGEERAGGLRTGDGSGNGTRRSRVRALADEAQGGTDDGAGESFIGGDNAGGLPAAAESDGGQPSDGSGVSGQAGEVSERPSAPAPTNYVIKPSDDIGGGSPLAKMEANLAAIETLKKIESENRAATPAEQSIMAKYVGFGGLVDAFPNPATGKHRRSGFEALGARLKELTTADEYKAARASTLNAHYTSPDIINNIYRAVTRLGFKGGAVLEPGSGIGNFVGSLPKNLAGKTLFTGVELDSLTGRMAKLIYPESDMRVADFTEVKLPDSSFDMVVGNVPFADVKYSYDGNRYSLHDYFMLKSMDKLKPGGVMAVITSRYTLDKQSSAAREKLAEQADLVGAIRLPDNAFKKNAGTDVVADLIILRKRKEGEPVSSTAWTKTGNMVLAADKPAATINEYFITNPDMMLGTPSLEGNMYGGDQFTLKPSGNLENQLSGAIGQLPENVINTGSEKAAPMSVIALDSQRDTNGQGLLDGSLFISKDGKIMISAEGTPQPALYLGKELVASKGAGERVASLIRLRDAATHVLATQNDMEPQPVRDSARRELNRVYDDFVQKHGAINLTKVTKQNRTRKVLDEDGKETTEAYTIEIRRLPNLAGFNDDPLSTLVMSLENYDEDSGKAEKAAIMSRDVIEAHQPVNHVDSPLDGIPVSLNEKGKLDIAYIAQLTGQSEEEVISSLGNLIYKNPEGDWETAEEYLSGNVRKKLRAAQEAGSEFARNVKALENVQPDDLEPSEIDASLGSPWVPTDDVANFVAELLEVSPDTVKVSYSKSEATWRVRSDAGRSSALATTTFGTDRYNAIALVEDALNLKLPEVKDTLYVDGKETRVVNQDATLAAREKQSQLKERFSTWVWEDTKRATRLSRFYNDEYNNIRLRTYDGSHLTFPGMVMADPAHGFTGLRQHQKDAVWRSIQGGNTLLHHEVGLGKTMIMVAANQEKKRLGLVKKPVIVVPNHMLEQFSREYLQLYPNAKILIAAKDEFSARDRALLAARIAANPWDAIIMTHSSFEKMPVTPEFQKRFIEEQIEEYERIIIEAKKDKDTNLTKMLEAAKNKRKEKLKHLAAEQKKDTGLYFDKLGVDHITVDEAHLFKNLEYATKMTRVAGLSNAASQRAFDLYLKTRYLSEKYGDRNVLFATATPISNSMAEMFTMQRYLQEGLMKERNLAHFDAWAAAFGDVVSTMELSPDGKSLRANNRFARFKNLPELMQMYLSFADVKDASMVSSIKRPDIKGGKPELVIAEPSMELLEKRDELVERLDAIRRRAVKPEEDNALNVVTEGRKAALDMRLLGSTEDFEGSKVNKLVEKVTQIWKQGADKKLTQVIFSDLGNPQPAPGQFSVYDDIIKKLKAAGIPADQIAKIHDYNDDLKKAKLFSAVREGRVRILLGSTAKMGVGTNVQKRLYAVHHLDAPWRPADLDQRDGRIVRQGNLNEEVEVIRYVTEGSFDAYIWQTLENKARFIAQAFRGEAGVRRIEDIGTAELSYAEAKAIASGNPAIMELAQTEAEVGRLERLEKAHRDEQIKLRANTESLPSTIAALKEKAANLETDAAARVDISGDNFRVEIGGKVYTDRTKAATALEQAVRSAHLKAEATNANAQNPVVEKIGTVAGFRLGVWAAARYEPQLVYKNTGQYEVMLEAAATGASHLSRLENNIKRIGDKLTRVRDEIADAEKKLKVYQSKVGEPFGKAEELTKLKTRQKELQASLQEKPTNAPPPRPDEVAFMLPYDPRKEILGSDDENLSPLDETGIRYRLLPELHEKQRQLERIVKNEYRKSFGDGAAIKFAEKILSPDGQEVDGFIYPRAIAGKKYEYMIFVSIAEGTGDVKHRLNHEGIHYLYRSKALPEGLWTEFQYQADKYWIDRFDIRERYEEFFRSSHPEATEEQIKMLLQEEAIAEAYATWAGGQSVTESKPVLAFFRKLREFFRNLYASLKGIKIEKWEDAFEQIRAGEFANPSSSVVLGESAIQYSLPPAHRDFYSALERGIEAVTLNKAPARQWMGIINNLASKGVRKEEVEWTGINEWLAEKGAATKDEVLQFIRENMPQVTEVLKGGNKPPSFEEWAKEYSATPSSPTADDRRRYDRYIEMGDPVTGAGTDDTKFSKYTLPGGREYRELLLTLPYVTPAKQTFSYEQASDEITNKRAIEVQKDGKFVQNATSEYALSKFKDGGFTFHSYEVPKDSAQFRSTHYSEPNIVAHIRFASHVDNDGRNIMLLEEVQSDWHQAGRRRGYKQTSVTDFKVVPQADGSFIVESPQGIQIAHTATRQRAENIAGRNNESGVVKDGVPDAPFKQSWHELAMKHALRYAVDNGFDGIAWTTGKTQVDRYTLSKQLNEVYARPIENGKFDVVATDKEGVAIQAGEFTAEQLPDVVGKELARVIVEKNGGKFTGLELDVGGEGMTYFYDKMLTSFMTKYVKKWGAVVSKTEITTDSPYTIDAEDISADDDAKQEVVVRNSMTMEGVAPAFNSIREAEEWLDKNDTGRTTAHFVEITPSMQQSIVGEGQPMFMRPPLEPEQVAGIKAVDAATGGAGTRAMKSMINGLKKLDTADPNLPYNGLVMGAREIFRSNDHILEVLIKAYKSKAIQRVRDMLYAVAGSGRAVGQTYDEGIQQNTTLFLTKLNTIFKGMNKRERELVTRVLQEPDKAITDNQNVLNAARDAAKLMRQHRDYLKDAGITLSDTKGYFPRQYLISKIRSGEQAFISAATEVYLLTYRDLFQEQAKSALKSSGSLVENESKWLEDRMRGLAREMAETWASTALAVDSGLEVRDNGLFQRSASMPAPDNLKPRVLSKEADELLRPFLEQDPLDAIGQMFVRTVRHAEFEKRFSGEKWKELVREMREEGVHRDSIQLVTDAVISSTYNMAQPRTATGRTTMQLFRLWGYLTFLPSAAWSALHEPTVAAIHTRSVWLGLKSLLLSARLAVPGKKKREVAEMAESIMGIAGEVAEHLLMQYRTADHTANAQFNDVAFKFFRKTALSGLTDLHRRSSMLIGFEYIKNMAKDYQQGRGKKSAEFLLRDYGIPASRMESWTKWVVENGFTKESLQQMDGFGDFTSDAGLARVAIRRFIDRNIQAPKAVERQYWAQSPVGNLIFSLQSFAYAYSKNVLLRDVKMTKEALTGPDYTLRDRYRMLPSVFAYGLVLAAAAAVRELRDEWRPREERRKKEEAGEYGIMDRLRLAVSSAGLLGGLDSYFNLMYSVRYNRDPATGLIGPLPGAISELLKAGIGLAVNNTESNNNKERKFFQTAYNLTIQPVLNGLAARYLPGFIGAAAIQTVSHPEVRENLFVTPIAGRKMTKQEINQGAAETRRQRKAAGYYDK